MQAEGLSEEQKVQRRQELAQDERKYIRLQRKRMSSEDFEALKLIGRGAFGEVCLEASQAPSYQSDQRHHWRPVL